MTIAIAILLIPKLKGDESWKYALTSDFTSPEFSQRSRETVTIRVEKVSNAEIQLAWSQKLDSTEFDGVVVPTDPSATAAIRKWTALPSGKIAFSEFERNTGEGILQRVIRAAMEQDLSSAEWVTSFDEETVHLQPAAVAVLRQTKNRVRIDSISYRQKDGMRGLGQAIWHPKLLFPELLTITIPKIKLPGGTDWGQSKIELRYIPPTPKSTL